MGQKQKLSSAEKKWAVLHPIAAWRVKHLSKKFYPLYASKTKSFNAPDFVNGGRPDAFRHTFFMAMCAQKINVKKLRQLGRAHEKGNYLDFKMARKEDGERPDSLSSVMDLHNNELGFVIGANHKHLKPEELSVLVIKEIENGKALIMKRKKNGTYLDCNDQILEIKPFAEKWYVPKCLVPSNTAYSD